jgi:pyruvate dehydrogenase E1 component alpha subunit
MLEPQRVAGGRASEILRVALTARRFEARIALLANAGELPGTLHVGAGHEVCQAAALAALRPDDPMLYGHRGTAYFVARGIPLGRILCDLAGREGGTNRGRGGVMHVVDAERGVLGESGTLGGNFVVGVGIAFADQYQNQTNAVTIVFFGDGTSNRGQFHEAANFAALRRLPIVFFCENNGWGLSMSAGDSTSVADIADRAAGYGMPGVVVDGGDADAVYAATERAAARARTGQGPTLIEAKVRRIAGHWLADREHYRDEDERAAAASTDPLATLLAKQRDRGLLDDQVLSELEAAVDAEIDEAVAYARAQPLADVAAAREGVFA